MARPQQFDRQQALESAMLVFWQQGYGASSMAQLLSAMDISRSSFYASFGDKRSLFVQCLELFFQRTLRFYDQQAAGNAPLNAIRCFFHSTLVSVPDHRRQLGCLMVNSVLELADNDNELRDLASDKLAAIEQIFVSCYLRAKALNQIDGHRDCRQLAQMTMLLNKGLRVTCREHHSQTEIEQQLNSVYAVLGIKGISEKTI